jgi:hypothetical protein
MLNRQIHQILIIIISLLICPHCWGTGLLYGLPNNRTGHNPPTHNTGTVRISGCYANSTGANGLTYLPKNGEARDKTFLATHPMTDKCCLVLS